MTKKAQRSSKVIAAVKLPPPGGFWPKAGEPEGRCQDCSFQPTSSYDFCDVHRKELFSAKGKVKRGEA